MMMSGRDFISARKSVSSSTRFHCGLKPSRRNSWRSNSASSGESSTIRRLRGVDMGLKGERLRLRLRLGTLEGEIEGGAFFRLGFRPDAAAVTLDDALDDGQAHAAAFKLIGRMQALKDAEEFVGVRHLKTGTVVPDEINAAARFSGGAD